MTRTEFHSWLDRTRASAEVLLPRSGRPDVNTDGTPRYPTESAVAAAWDECERNGCNATACVDLRTRAKELLGTKDGPGLQLQVHAPPPGCVGPQPKFSLLSPLEHLKEDIEADLIGPVVRDLQEGIARARHNQEQLSMQDSGTRTEFTTGSQRDTQQDKGRPSLIPTLVLRRLAKWFGLGASKYQDRNWELGQPLSQYYDSASRHMQRAFDGATDEDHEAAWLWNAQAFMWTRHMIEIGQLPESLDDRPRYGGHLLAELDRYDT